MGIHALHLRKYIIRPTLELLDLPSADRAEDFLYHIAGAESEYGRYLRQHPQGPALGVYQMEVETYHDHWINFLDFKTTLRQRVLSLIGEADPMRMVWDLRHATIMARIDLYRDPEPLPEVGDLRGQAEYWKKNYNTHRGHGTVAGFIMKNTAQT